MTIIELYINNRLCDIGRDFGVRLNRQLLNPGELNTKDAQYSYSITLPPTSNNHAIFNYANIEETANKFNREYKAELIINSVRVFVGLFRLSEVTRDKYKGNLYIPATKSIKDIFGELKLNENPEYRIEFKDFAEYVSYYNILAATGPQMAIFPYTLYGVLPKVPLNHDVNNYSPRNIWDDSVRIGMQDLAPSINPLLILKHIFNAQGYKLGGTAFDDERLARLYMSYKNDVDYVQPWNYGQHAKFRLTGSWASTYNKRTGASGRELERGVNQNDVYYSCDIFDANNTLVNIVEDSGGNVLYKTVNDANGRTWAQCQVRIPTSGFYKVQLNASLRVYDAHAWRSTDPVTGVQHVCNDTNNANNNMFNKMYEFRLLRDRGKGDFGISGAKLDGNLYYNNQPQNNRFATIRDIFGRETVNPNFDDNTDIPKYFPQVNSDGQINFIDAAQDKNIVLGFAFGRRDGADGGYQNPRDTGTTIAQVQAAKPALSWDTAVNDTVPTRLAIKSPGYWKYGRIGNFDNEDDNPNVNIDYSEGTKIVGKVLDEHGNPRNPEEGEIADSNIILSRFRLDRYFTYILKTPTESNYTGYAFVHAGTAINERIKVEFVNGEALFNTSSFGVFGDEPRLTLYLATANYNVDGTLTISKQIQPGSEDIIDWELSDKYKIDLNNAPLNYARRSNNLNGQGSANAVVWFNAGELVTLASVSEKGRYRQNGMHTTYGWTEHEVTYDLSIQPFRIDTDWLKVNYSGNGTAVMNWNDPVNFDVDSINLVGFLPADMKTDDFIDNFCKAFNLQLTQIDAATFELNVKQSKTAVSNLFINLDNLASVRDRSNTPLGLPSLYKLGFTVDVEEEGYVTTGDDGGGEYATGVTEEKVVEQKSSFSFNWFKNITKQQPGGNIVLPLAVISKHEVWTGELSYPDAMKKRYPNQALRFWYSDGLLNDTGASFDFNGKSLSIVKVSNELAGLSTLSYKNQRLTILDTYFTVLINGSSHYTEIEGYLTPTQYEALNGAILAMFNGDLYYVAELSGYDPTGRNKTKIKLIRKI